MTEKPEQSGSAVALDKEKVVNALNERGVKRECPRCGNNSWSLVPGYVSQTIQKDPKIVEIAGRSIPTIVLICSRCGYLSQHSAIVMGLIPREEEKNNE